MQRFFIAPSQINNNIAEITGSDARQIQKVLRSKIGDKLIVCDGTEKAYDAEISAINKGTVSLKILRELNEETESTAKITLAQCLPKGSKMDFIIQKSVELGVFDIIPIISERSIPKISDKSEKKQERWQKIAKEAAEQSGRLIIPQVHPIQSFDDLLKSSNKYDLKMIPWELEKENRLRAKLQMVGTGRDLSLLIIVGPEGGFSQNEIKSAKSAGFIPITLGKRILRTETAPIAILSNIFYELDS
ncbi:hypothetical protein A2276_01745 [candidate division WOR-1 bacterium RIFOXYA12_FULL_43_27]|uniref:Ribosomal RNA small subunit methyltransferase E n=1 Tax=candidate division WOR-1 bacterium RIFOXYC2_FULL_46_14 TaxID=1802587 RepID=A0A1F4U6W1_UNCSA|nr:MAG: hypothetical protein A2276_01745 [candidate division WOR-1 bacterium RIFOXYA12_FULL_43_27]OGC19552.1 MAG: hypothetical protein A2292_02585 [candidate division WOR-1 bacterium RIFOXYB2_FULL_46_45]OGC30540.1 MAG: hypothetical protein A2232_02585 [candidate division WOR-1 bacterium RIFOXYA2_FULL_46_56]OGC40607.1 MAG: hypothetical protein A2438_06300 [candidate division WOR-1 bacterium RIFOXYC2_FULL_46_14]